MDINKERVLERVTRNSPGRWKERGFSMLPHSLLNDQRLSRSSLIVYWVLAMHSFRGQKYCFPSLGTIAKECHSSPPTIIKAIKQLREYGHLTVDGDKKSGKVNKYCLKAKV